MGNERTAAIAAIANALTAVKETLEGQLKNPEAAARMGQLFAALPFEEKAALSVVVLQNLVEVHEKMLANLEKQK